MQPDNDAADATPGVAARPRPALDIAIVVADPSPAIAFYRDVIGLRYIEEVPVPGGARLHRFAFGSSYLKLVVPPDPPPARYSRRMITCLAAASCSSIGTFTSRTPSV